MFPDKVAQGHGVGFGSLWTPVQGHSARALSTAVKPMATSRKRSYARRRRAAAFHEAGHVVACLYVGAGSRTVWINETGGGYTHGTRHAWPWKKDQRMWTWLLVLFAGSYAQALACGRRVDRVMLTSGKLDLREAKPAVDWLVKRGYVETSLEALAAAHLATCIFLTVRWPAIERVAHALLESGRLTGRQVRSLAESRLLAGSASGGRT